MASASTSANTDSNQRPSSSAHPNRDKDKLAGVVITLKNDTYGFIRAEGGLPPGFNCKDIFFSVKSLHGDKVYEGDAVTFLLNKDRPEKPEARQVWISERPSDWRPPAQKSVIEKVQSQGKICSLKENGCGFIRVKNLPKEYAGFHSEIYFDPNWVQCGELTLLKGDTLELTISTSKKYDKKLAAHQIRLVECQPRSNDEIYEHVHKLIRKVTIMDDTDTDIIISILRCDATWKCIGNAQDLEDDTISRLLTFFQLLQINSKALSQYFSIMLATFTKTDFFRTRRGCFVMFVKTAWTCENKCFQEQVKQFLLILLDHLPGKARMVASLVKEMVPEGTDSIEHFLYMVIKKISALNLEDILDFDWEELPLVPSSNELMMSPLEALENLSPVKIHGPYESTEEYMDTYFRLLRADCFSALRIGIQSFLKGNLDSRDMHIYSQVSLVNVRITENGGGIMLGLKVKPQKRIDKWEVCSNLQFGNLLCLSTLGSFKDCIWASVIDRDTVLLKSHGIIWVELISICNNEDDGTCIANLFEANGKTIMAESPTYYNAYKPVLKALQKCDIELLPFQEELVHLQPPYAPDYIDPKLIVEHEDMDESQNRAFAQALSHRIGIIQGPPGTGKTFIGIRLVKHLLEQEDAKFPILILTYKNHALDEFLKAISDFLPNGIVRVGGRSQDPILEKCNLNILKRDHPRSITNVKQRQELISETCVGKITVERQIRKLQTATQFTLETLIRDFDVDQVEQILMGFMAIDQSNLKSKSQIAALWEKNKSLLEKDLSAKELIGLLDPALVDFISKALKRWIPPAKEFNEIMKREERLSHMITAQPKGHKQDTKSGHESDSDIDEMDIVDQEKERLAAVWLPKRKEKSDPIVKFTNNDDSVKIPYNGNTGARLAAEVPLLALRRIENLWSLSNYDRILIIQVVLRYQMEEVKKELKIALADYKQVLGAKQELDDNHKVSVLQEKMVIGMTITGASINQNLLQALRPAIIIVEEAAEVLEPQLIAVFGNWVKHMILIGDHKQLRPSVENYELAQKYHLDVSMMERLINNKYPFASLKMQNRMLPEMAELLEDIYPDLQSNPATIVKNIPPNFLPPMFFWAHEDEETHERSFSNIKEAERVVKLTLLFLQQGYKPSEITVLAAYQGQVKILRKMFLKAETEDYPNLFGPSPDVDIDTSKADEPQASIKVHTIDMFQGDENKIVIASLVRSNSHGQIGFLKTMNRRCVVQSRAQCGLYFVGNIVTFLTAKGSCWLTLISKLNSRKLVSKSIPLHCSVHEKTKISAQTAADVPLTGLCKQNCSRDMDCGLHLCVQHCQPFHQHTKDKCNKIVKFLHPICKHPVQRKCYQAESSIQCDKPCIMMMNCGKHPCPSVCQPEHSHLSQYCIRSVVHKFVDCQHVSTKICGEDETQLRCQSKVPFKFQSCAHFGNRKCWQKEDEVVCKEACTRELSCHHPCEGYCGVPCDAATCKTCKNMRKIEMKRQREAEKKIREEARQKAQEELEVFNKKNPNPDERCHCQILSGHGDTASEYFDVHDLVLKYVQPGHNWFPNVTKIEKLINLKLQKEWLEAKANMFDSSHTALKFHGTGDDGIKGITNKGFRVGSEGMYGAGVYFATDSSKSAQTLYTKGSNKLLLCDVLIGKSMNVTEAKPKMTADILRKAKYDSLFASRGTAVRYDEYIVYSASQALPKYIIHYSHCGLQDMPKLNGSGVNITGLQHHHLVPIRDFSTTNTLDLHFRLAESQFLRLKKNADLKVKSVDYYVNPKLITKFTSKKNEFMKKYTRNESSEILAFHGTAETNIDNIITNNFDLAYFKTGVHGAGMYFSEFPDVSIEYARGNRKLILCQLLPGRSFDCHGNMNNAPLQPGYDSHIVGADSAGRGWAVVLYNSDQVLPTYVINF